MAFGGAALLGAACSGPRPPGANIPNALICAPGDLGGAYFMQMAGEFSTRNLADLADNAPQRKTALEAAGLRGGRFNYWKQAVGRPPFATPIEAVCQATEFGTEAEATRFVRDLQADPGDVATTAITWLPADGRKAEELSPPNDPALPRGTRAFRLEGSSPEANVALYVVLAPQGRFVQGVYMGRGAATLDDTAAVLAHLAGRSGTVAPAR